MNCHCHCEHAFHEVILGIFELLAKNYNLPSQVITDRCFLNGEEQLHCMPLAKKN